MRLQLQSSTMDPTQRGLFRHLSSIVSSAGFNCTYPIRNVAGRTRIQAQRQYINHSEKGATIKINYFAGSKSLWFTDCWPMSATPSTNQPASSGPVQMVTISEIFDWHPIRKDCRENNEAPPVEIKRAEWKPKSHDLCIIFHLQYNLTDIIPL